MIVRDLERVLEKEQGVLAKDQIFTSFGINKVSKLIQCICIYFHFTFGIYSDIIFLNLVLYNNYAFIF